MTTVATVSARMFSKWIEKKNEQLDPGHRILAINICNGHLIEKGSDWYAWIFIEILSKLEMIASRRQWTTRYMRSWWQGIFSAFLDWTSFVGFVVRLIRLFLFSVAIMNSLNCLSFKEWTHSPWFLSFLNLGFFATFESNSVITTYNRRLWPLELLVRK